MFNGSAISGATNSSFTITNVATNQTGSYSVTATNAYGTTNSVSAWMQVYPSAMPLLSASSISNGQMTFSVSGITNTLYAVQMCTNLSTSGWANVYTGMVTYIYIDPMSVTNTNGMQRFYRAVWLP